jgi:AsmA family/AsmA-like C-terminal region
MSVWKSPIFYFGILLVMAVLGALAAPFVINWNNYRDNLEGWGQTLTGRQVAISGPISVRLFPWPRLVAEDVSISNPKEFPDAPLMNAKRIDVQLALAGLFNGDIQVEAIELEQPKINVTRNADGQGNWVFQLGKSGLLEKVKLEQIKIRDGFITVRDQAHNFNTTVEHLNAVLSASEFVGPWRVRGTAINNGVPLDLTFASSAWKKDEPFKFSFKVSPLDGALPAFVFDGTQSADKIQGKVSVDPVVTEDGRQSLDQSFKPLQMKADITASFNEVKLDKIKIVPADTKDNGTLIEGVAIVKLDSGVKADVSLSSPRIDLDSLAGGQSLRVWRAGGVMALLNRVIAEFPEKLDLTAAFEVSSLSAAGETLENVKVKSSAQKGAVRIQNFTANLPGRSAMKFDGIVFPGVDAAELGGSLAMESNDMRAFVSWLWPEGKASLAQYWTGARGRLKAQSDVTWSGKRFGFQNLKYELDGEQGTAELAVSLGKLPSVDLRLNSKLLDLDNYINLKRESVLSGVFASSLAQSESGFDKRLNLNAAKIRLNGVEAQDVALDFSSSFSGFEIKALNIGSVEGARVNGAGLVLEGPDGPSGDMKLSVKAENPRGLLRLLGAFPKGPDPAWAGVLGATDMKADVAVRPGKDQPKITFGASGNSGPIQLSATGDIKDLSKGRDATFGMSAELSSAEGGDLSRFFGFTPLLATTGSGKMTVVATGASGIGYKTALRGNLFDADFVFDGNIKPNEKLSEINGAASVAAKDGTVLGRALGLEQTSLFSGPLELKTFVSTAEQTLQVSALSGQLGGQAVTGEGSINADGALNANIGFEHLDLPNVLATVFMPWRNGAPALDDGFAPPVPNGFHGEVWLRPMELQNLGSSLKESVIGINFERHSRSVSIASQERDNEPFMLELNLREGDNSFALTGSGHGSISIAPFLMAQNGSGIANGRVVLDGEFQGQGRSPQAILSSLVGKGSYELQDAAMVSLSPDPFYKKLDVVQNADGLQQAFDGLLKGPGFVLAAEKQDVTIDKGNVLAAPLRVVLENANVEVSPSFDLSGNVLKTLVQLSSKIPNALPDIKVSYEGPPGALARRSDTSAISAKLGYAFIARDMAELDRVKKEQEKLAAEELEQTQADEAKFAAFQAQRLELRLRLREMKVHASQRAIEAERKKAEMDQIIEDSLLIKKLEYPRFLRRARGL